MALFLLHGKNEKQDFSKLKQIELESRKLLGGNFESILKHYAATLASFPQNNIRHLTVKATALVTKPRWGPVEEESLPFYNG